jgi:hypothetical protein
MSSNNEEFKDAFEKRVGKISYSYDPTSAISYKARNTNKTVCWRAELQEEENEGDGAKMTLALVENLTATMNGLGNIQEVSS